MCLPAHARLFWALHVRVCVGTWGGGHGVGVGGWA